MKPTACAHFLQAACTEAFTHQQALALRQYPHRLDNLWRHLYLEACLHPLPPTASRHNNHQGRYTLHCFTTLSKQNIHRAASYKPDILFRRSAVPTPVFDSQTYQCTDATATTTTTTGNTTLLVLLNLAGPRSNQRHLMVSPSTECGVALDEPPLLYERTKVLMRTLMTLFMCLQKDWYKTCS